MNRRLGLALAVPVLLAAGKPQPDPRRATEWTVAPGETLGGIARKVEVPRVLIIEANALKAPFHVRIGQTLVIPRRRERVVKAGETGFSIAYDQGVPWREIATASGLDPAAPLRPGQKLIVPTPSKPAPAAAAVKAAEDEGRAEAGDHVHHPAREARGEGRREVRVREHAEARRLHHHRAIHHGRAIGSHPRWRHPDRAG